MVGISRTPVWHFVDENRRHEHPTDIPKFEIYASNLGIEDCEVELRLRMYDWSVHKELELKEDVRKQTFKVKANQATELLKLDSPKEVEESSFVSHTDGQYASNTPKPRLRECADSHTKAQSLLLGYPRRDEGKTQPDFGMRLLLRMGNA